MTDEHFRAWVRRRPSCLSGRYSEYVDGEGRSIAAHVRRAASSGTGYKAPFSCVALTNDEHRIQHLQGEAACLEAHFGRAITAEEAKAWFDERLAETLKRYREESAMGA